MQKTILPGLVSVTFRHLPPGRIIDLTAGAGLQGIEWGGDVHVPHGDLETARRVGQATRAAGTTVAAYGSYYHAAESETQGLSFAAVLNTARALQAPTIRVWAGTKASAAAAAAYRKRVVDDLRRIATQARKYGISISIEFHAGTLTDTNESAARLFREIDHPNVFSYWQPAVGAGMEANLRGLQQILPVLSNVHVFHWHLGNGEIMRRPLAEGEADWQHYFSAVAGLPKGRYALLEFVRKDDEQQFFRDAAVLRRWLQQLGDSEH